jgi:hypothetical protein
MIVADLILSDDSVGQFVMVWSVRAAVACYLLRVASLLARGSLSGVPTLGDGWLWSLGCFFYLVHVIMAFEHVHQWSHRLAWEHTARVTGQLTGLARGEGIWANYLFTVIWIVDATRLWVAHTRGRKTNRSVDIAIQAVFAFIVFNATVVFGPAIYRWLAVPAGGLLAWAWRSGNR